MIGIGFLSLDILIILILFILLFLLSFKMGKKLLVSLIISTYPTVLIFKNIPYEKINLGDQVVQAIIFLILYVLTTFVLWKNIHVKKYHGNTRKVIDYTLLTLAYLILIVSININSISALSYLYELTGSVTNFISYIPYSIALIIPIVIILITNRKDLE